MGTFLISLPARPVVTEPRKGTGCLFAEPGQRNGDNGVSTSLLLFIQAVPAAAYEGQRTEVRLSPDCRLRGAAGEHSGRLRPVPVEEGRGTSLESVDRSGYPVGDMPHFAFSSTR